MFALTVKADRADRDYEQRRRAAIWNAVVPPRFPDVIVNPTAREQVAPIVRHAISAGHRVGIKSGGHNWLGAAIRDGGTLIDLGALQGIEVRADAGLALAEPGATHKLLADAVVPHGLAFPIGHCPTVGLGGYLLAGGFGWNKRSWGPACWSVEALDVVTVDGEELEIGEASYPDLYWAARGGGGGFPGFVTRFHLRLKALPKIWTWRGSYPLECLPDLLVWAGEQDRLGEGTEIALIARRPPPSGADTDQHLDGRRPIRVIVAITGFGDTEDDATELVLKAAAQAPRADDLVGTPASGRVALNDLEGPTGWIHGLRYAVDCLYVKDLRDVATECAAALEAAPSDLTRMVFAGGKRFGSVDSPPDVALAEHAPFSVNLYATWEDLTGDAPNLAWLKRTVDALEPRAKGYYAGESDLGVSPDRPRRCYSEAIWDRLVQVRSKYDPERRKFGYLSED